MYLVKRNNNFSTIRNLGLNIGIVICVCRTALSLTLSTCLFTNRTRQIWVITSICIVLEYLPPDFLRTLIIHVWLCTMKDKYTLAQSLNLFDIYFLSSHNAVLLAHSLLFRYSGQCGNIIFYDVTGLQLHIGVTTDRINIQISPTLAKRDAAIAHRSCTELFLICT